MGYGGTGYATVDVDIVQTDVDAIVQGLTGYGGMTFSDVHDRLGFATDLLSGNYYGPITDTAWNTNDIRNYMSGNYGGPLTDIAGNTWGLRDYLAGYSYGPLTDIRDCLWADGYSAAWWMRESASAAWGAREYLSGYSYGPLTGIEGNTWYIENNTWQVRDYLSGYNYGPLTEARDALWSIDSRLYSGYWGASAADILGDIRNILYQLTFDYDGRLRVSTN